MKLQNISCQLALGVSLLGAASASQAGLFGLFESEQPAQPVQALPMTASQILGSEVWIVDGNNSTAWQVTTTKTKKTTTSNLTQKSGKQGFVTSQITTGNIVHTNGKFQLERPVAITNLKNGDIQLAFGDTKNPIAVDVNMKAYDVSGQKIADYLKTRDGNASADAEKVGNAKFPAGSLAYKAVTTFSGGEMVLPLNESFTNAKTPNDVVANFSSVPFCVGHDKRYDAKAYGVVFDKAAPKATSGKFQILPVRKDTIFCNPEQGAKSVGTGSWNVVSTGHSQAVVLTLPNNIDPRDFGIKENQQGIAKVAFIAPAKGDTVFRPGHYYVKGSKFESKRYLFNTTAAKAAMQAAGIR